MSTEIATPTSPSRVRNETPLAEEDDIMAGTGPELDAAPDNGQDGSAFSSTVDDSFQNAPPPPPPAPTETEKREERRKKTLGADEKKRGKRLFGGLLGTLDAFKKEERQRGASDAAKRRDLISNRIQNKLRSETSTALEISSKEREMKTIRVEADKKEAELALRSDSFASRHHSLPRLAAFLHTSMPDCRPTPTLLDLSSPVPLGQAASHKKGSSNVMPLFYLPAVLLPVQQEKIDAQKKEADALVDSEQREWTDRRREIEAEVQQLRSKELDLQVDLSTLRKQKAELSGTPPPSTTTPVAQPSPATNTTIKAPMQAEPNTVAASESPAPVIAAVASTAAAPPAEEGLGEVEMQDGDEAVEY